MDKKVPERTCIGCKLKRDKKDLVRIVRSPDGTVAADETGRMNGRGAYICNDMGCLDKALMKKSFDRAFKSAVSAEDISKLREYMSGRSTG